MLFRSDLPQVPEDYVHRIGRTGRAGADGLAVSLVSIDEYKQLKAIERVIGHQFEREIIAGFEPKDKASAPSAETAKRPPRRQGQGQRRSSGNAAPRGRSSH